MSVARRVERQGFTVYELRSETVAVGVIPALGAKIVSLRSLATGREWMGHAGRRLRLFRNRSGDRFSDSPLAGADECFPTVAACRVLGRAVPDHGEAWNRAWRVDARAWKTKTLRTTLTLPLSPLGIERTVSVEGSTVRLAYVLVNRSRRRQPYLWAFHPLLAMDPGDRLEIAGLSPAFRLLKAHGLAGEPGDTWRFPRPRAGVRLDRLDLGGPGTYAKLFATAARPGRASVGLRKSDGTLRLSFDPQDVAALGLWISRGGWRGHEQLALEPTTGAADSLADLVAGAAAAWLEPLQHRRFEIAFELLPG